MKTLATIILLFLTSMSFAIEKVSTEEEALNKVRFFMRAQDGIYAPPDNLACLHKDVLKKREARNPLDPPITTFAVVEATAHDPEIFEQCQKDFANLTNLDQQKVRDDLGEILASMKCKPDHHVTVLFNSFENNKLGALYPGIRHNRIINRVRISGCIDIHPDVCTFPVVGESFNANYSVVDYEKMMASFKACRDAVNKYVEDNGLEAKWAREAKTKGESR